MKYAFFDLSNDQFEKLVVALCEELLGMGVQGFAPGVDGGRDATFEGTANRIPSESLPWRGKIVVQAKHTNGIDRYYRDVEFFSESSESCVLALESARVKRLRDEGHLDHYLLVANRRLTGNAHGLIQNYLSNRTGLPTSSILFYGTEDLDRHLERFPGVVKRAAIDPIESPLRIDAFQLAEVVEEISDALKSAPLHHSIPEIKPRVSIDEKDKINGVSPELSAKVRSSYSKNLYQIRKFLENPQNLNILDRYQEVTEEFQIRYLSGFASIPFGLFLEKLIDYLCERNSYLESHKRLTRSILYYMYFNCDLGKTNDDIPY